MGVSKMKEARKNKKRNRYKKEKKEKAFPGRRNRVNSVRPVPNKRGGIWSKPLEGASGAAHQASSGQADRD